MPWKKANKELIQLLEKSAAEYPCDRHVMFGSPTFFVNNNMFAGVHEDTVIMRLADSDREKIYSEFKEVKPFTPMGRPMKEYAALPEKFVKNAAVFNEWLGRSYKYAQGLAPKKAGKRKQSDL
jgi:TfoX/Sxy family transcriptional regulator of competence genes